MPISPKKFSNRQSFVENISFNPLKFASRLQERSNNFKLLWKGPRPEILEILLDDKTSST